MKKIISMGIASAVLALTAVAAYAESAEATATPAFSMITEPENPVTGGEFTVEFIGESSDVSTLQFSVETEGLEYVSADYKAGDTTLFDADTKAFGTVGGIEEGKTFLTLTFTVTANVGEAVSVKVVPGSVNFEAVMPEVDSITLQVVEGGDTSDLTPSGSDSGSGSESTDGGDTTNPPTGIALAIVPAVLAGAGVVVAKKRK